MTGVVQEVAVTNPFPGLRPFREDEEYLFFGRESQIDRMVDKLAVSRFLAVVGTSGSGKSSLVNCGLRPALRRGLMSSAGTAWRFVQFRPGASPVEAMAQALAADNVLFAPGVVSGMPLTDLVAATLRMSNLGLADVYEQARLPERTNLLVVVDQFEELFRFQSAARSAAGTQFGAGEEATTFVNLLLAAQAQTALPIFIVLTMRSDFLGDCAQFYGLPEAINEGQYLVPRMTRDQRKAAIAGPAEVMGAQISPLLLTRLVNDTGDNPDQLSILQHALNRTWAHWQHDRSAQGPLSIESYEAIGTMTRALDAHAEKAVHELPSERQQMICEKVFKALTDRGTDPRGIRRPTSVERLCAIADVSPRELEEVIAAFRKPSRSFLMPPVPEVLTAQSIIDISHESLMRVWKRLDTWTQEEAASARTYRRMQDTAALHAAGKAGLWRDPDLQIALDWKGKERPTEQWADFYGGGLPDVLAFIERSKAEQDEEKAEVEFERRWMRRIVIPAGILLFGLYAYTMRTWLRGVEGFISNRLPTSLPGAARDLLGSLLEITLPAIPFILAGWAIVLWSRRPYRQYEFSKVLATVSAVTMTPAAVPAQTATKPAAEALGTTYASFLRRAVACVIDMPLFAGLFFVGFVVLFMVNAPGTDSEPQYQPSDMAGWLVLGAAFVLHTLYHAGLEALTRRGTLGMRAAGIILTDEHGERITLLRALARQLTKVIVHVPFSVLCLMQPFTKRRQALHDLITKTVVLRAPSKQGRRTQG